tara:strand:- start:461 stop:946 length:486 start_codon:yes stop_codon:yes gene_type:complete
MTASAMTEQHQEQNLLFERYRRPCSEAEHDSISDYENIKLFVDVLSNALESVDLDFGDLAPKVLIDTHTGEIGIGFNQISILTKAGNISEAKCRKTFRDWGHHNYVFACSEYISCMIPGYMSLSVTDLHTAAIFAGIFAAAAIKKAPVTFPECPDCAAEAE